ncbi:MAG: ATP-binding cassette domain-containing protein [Vampirovibrionales bacterium]|nr:ATP-binding cassette domain-containing protein [Vampirovibrionales bacterium]
MHDGGHITPFQRLLSTLQQDRRDLLVLVLYTVFAGLLTLAIPLAAQALVNTIAAGVFVQPLLVLTGLLFVGMIFAGILRVAQFSLVEILQQRIFARVALNLAERVPMICHRALMSDYPPELLNRFFDVIRVQKAMAKILLDGPAAALQIFVGLFLMGVYSPLLLVFDLFVLGFLLFVAFGLGRRGVITSLEESIEKYRVAGWLEELARCQVSFKVDGDRGYLFRRADAQVMGYLTARRGHFRILFSQMVANHFFQAVASAGILGLGGWLVINRQLTLGQLVASELVILILLAAMDKLVTLFQDWYDLLTAIEKIAHVTELPLERQDGKLLPTNAQGATLLCQDVSFTYQPNTSVLHRLSFSIKSGEVVSLVGASGAGKSTLAAMVCGLLEPSSGRVEVNGVDIRALDLAHLRYSVALVNDTNEIFDGTIEENIVVGRDNVTLEQLNWALEITQLNEDFRIWPDGLKTRLISAGRNLSRGQIQRLMIARAIADRPTLLILDEAFAGIDERTKLTILDALMAPENPWTILDISHDAEVVIRSQRILVLQDGKIQESGAPIALAQQKNSAFSKLFPDLAASTVIRSL